MWAKRPEDMLYGQKPVDVDWAKRPKDELGEM